MMFYTFDLEGWFAGAVEAQTERCTAMEPMAAEFPAFPNWTGHAWVLLLRRDKPAAIPVTAASVWEGIKALRETKTQTGGYRVGTHWYHSDTFSRTQQMGLVMMGAGIPTGLQWKTMDGSFVTMTQTLAAQVFGAAAAQDQATFARAELLRAQVGAASDPASVDITSGWPATFV